jgi:hypothetical protein
MNIKIIGSSEYILFIVQGTLEKKRCERKGSQGNAQNPNAPIRVQKPWRKENNTFAKLNHKAYQI